MIGFLQSIVTVVLFFVILGGLVIIHELGHFVTARLAHVRVLEFGIGFPPRARVLRSKGETLYTLNWLPIGGFVKLEGEDGDVADDPHSFTAQGLPTRLWILVAGVLMNILLSLAIFTGMAIVGDPTIGFEVGSVQPSSPADAAGIRPGDVLVSLNGSSYWFMAKSLIVDDLRTHPSQTVTIGVEHVDGTTSTVSATLRDAVAIAANQGALGVGGLRGVTARGTQTHAIPEALSLGLARTGDALGLIVSGLGALVTSFANNPTAAPPVSGPVGIATQIGDIFWQIGPIALLYLAAILSANLAVVNVLPFPPLDGGRMLMITLKRFLGSRISVRAEQLTYMVGFVFLFGFIIWVTGFDIARGLGVGT